MSRERLLEMLGDPKTISSYGIAAPAEADGPLEYRFDSGFGGWEYVIEFRNGRVSAVRERGWIEETDSGAPQSAPVLASALGRILEGGGDGGEDFSGFCAPAL